MILEQLRTLSILYAMLENKDIVADNVIRVMGNFRTDICNEDYERGLRIKTDPIDEAHELKDEEFRDLLVSTIINPKENMLKLLREQMLVDEIIKGEWGDGEERRDKLMAAGYDYRHIQNLVNERLNNRKR